ncbi:hypothetical protein BKA70DRAFT_1220382 [Coprinopsis sp. MPI-PUGE-AT-0042]|nr:hypothetical protein BKA70DRAFT_1220382 [Coprinopsis sp. MPI-PUGE-AT-0042]
MLHILLQPNYSLSNADAKSFLVPMARGIKGSLADLVSRVNDAGRNAVAGSSKHVRAESQHHKWEYLRDPNGSQDSDIIRMPATTQDVQGKQADHIFEVQVVRKHLEASGVPWSKLPKGVQIAVKELINSKINMAPIEGRINSRKGQAIKSGTNKKPSGVKDQATWTYIQLSFGTAKAVADKLDNIYMNSKASSAHILSKQMPNLRTGARQYLIETVQKASGDPNAERWENISTSGSESSSQRGRSQTRGGKRRGSPEGSPGSPRQGKRRMKSPSVARTRKSARLNKSRG